MSNKPENITLRCDDVRFLLRLVKLAFTVIERNEVELNEEDRAAYERIEAHLGSHEGGGWA